MVTYFFAVAQLLCLVGLVLVVFGAGRRHDN
jgi:hypothetical protein